MRKLLILLSAIISLGSARALAENRHRTPPIPSAASITPVLTVTPANVAFGSVLETNLRTTAVTLKNPGTTAVTISTIATTGSAEFITTATWPVSELPFTLGPGESKTLLVIFMPDTAGGLSATFTIGGGLLSVSGTGVALSLPFDVILTWDAPESTDPAVGYNVFRAPAGSGLYVQLNLAPLGPTTFTDVSVDPGSWDYIVESLDAVGVASAPSNVYAATVP